MEKRKNVLTESLENLGIYDGDVIWVRDTYDNEGYYQLSNDKLISIDTVQSDDGPSEISDAEMCTDDIGALISGFYDYKIVARGTGYINSSLIKEFNNNQNELASCLDDELCQIKKSIKQIEVENQNAKKQERIEGIVSLAISGGLFFVLLLCLILGL